MDKDIFSYIMDATPITARVLDIGAGAGKWGRMLRAWYDIDGVEIFAPYIERFKLEDVYDKVFNQDVRDFSDFSDYNLVIMGDVLEHLSEKDAQALIKKITESVDNLIVIVPFSFEQGAEYGNKYEAHLQDDLTKEIMKQRYPQLRFMGECDVANGIAWYVKNGL